VLRKVCPKGNGMVSKSFVYLWLDAFPSHNAIFSTLLLAIAKMSSPIHAIGFQFPISICRHFFFFIDAKR
jgi:hypothetical protein